MYRSVTEWDFIDSIKCLRPDNFTTEALKLLFDWFEEYEEDSGEQVEFDPIAICCDFIESTPEEITEGYEIDIDDIAEYLQEQTIYVGETEKGFVYGQF